MSRNIPDLIHLTVYIQTDWKYPFQFIIEE